MTAQPTPGEVLNGESVRLLLPGDVLEVCEQGMACAGPGDRMIVNEINSDLVFCHAPGDPSFVWQRIPPRRFTFVSRPQPSGGQDGGGETNTDWRTCSRADYEAMPDLTNATQALTSPAKATGWPSRDDVSSIFRTAIRRYEDHPAMETQVAIADASNEAADAILALLHRPEDEGAA